MSKSAATTEDYHAHVHKMLRMPSVIDAPPYPNISAIFNKKAPRPDKQVEATQVTEPAQPDKQLGDNIDARAEGFIQQKRFALCNNWSTIKAR
uniref:Uncharacterized protein n=1 Tax=Nelumbo nucifera TaxID=4432 RepID=A0A822YUK3_NELNU|nr:TPA_asm: hypothetical protein HUJ06_005076 [Nelumbo nucifera]